MSNVYRIAGRKRPYREATAWLSKLDRGLAAGEEQELRAWLQADPNNVALFIESARMWDKMTSLSQLSDLFPRAPARRSRRLRLAAAATVLTAVGAALLAVVSRTFESPADPAGRDGAGAMMAETALYETAVGEQSKVAFSDGSTVVLNTTSQLRVRYTPHHRLLTLLQGEIHVDVAPDASRPLSVVVGDNIVQAIGTAFAVEITPDNNVELVVTEGEVRVAVRPAVSVHGAQTSTVPVLPSSSRTVAQGEELLLGEPDAKAIPVDPNDIEVRLSWREGNLVFRGESLEAAMLEVGRYTTVEFVFLDESLKRESIAGRFKAGDVDGLLAALRENFGVAYERTNDGRVLLSSL